MKKADFSAMTKEEALSYCYEHENQFKADAYAEGDDGVEQFDCLIVLLEDGAIQPKDLPSHGMEY